MSARRNPAGPPNWRSHIGTVLGGVYGIVSIAVVVFAQMCGTGWCGIVAILPVLPWFPFIRDAVEASAGFGSAPYGLVSLLSVLINLVLVYAAGLSLSWLIGVGRDRH